MSAVFNAATFTLPTATQELLYEVSGAVPAMRFSLFSEEKRIAREKTTIAFGAMVGGVKTRMGSAVIEEDHILILSMDGHEEYRACDTWQCIYFFRAFAESGYSWEEAERRIPRR